MKNKIKLLLTLIIATLSLTGCTVNGPTDIVETYFREIKNGEIKDVSKYLKESMEQNTNSEEPSEEIDPKMEEVMKILTSKLNAKVISEEIKDDKAVVTVEVEGINFSNIFLEIIGEAFNKAFSGEEMDENAMNDMILEKVKNAQTETRTGKVNLTMVDNEWKIETDEEIMSLILGNTQQ